MKSVTATALCLLILAGCRVGQPDCGLRHLSDRQDGLDPMDLEVHAIMAEICQSDDPDFGDLLEVMHQDLRLFYEPVTESNRRALEEFRERMAARRNKLAFAVTSKHVYGEDMVAEVVVYYGNGLPKVWYLLRSGKEGKLLLRATPDLPFGVAFRSFVLKLPKELVDQQKMVIEMYTKGQTEDRRTDRQ